MGRPPRSTDDDLEDAIRYLIEALVIIGLVVIVGMLLVVALKLGLWIWGL